MRWLKLIVFETVRLPDQQILGWFVPNTLPKRPSDVPLLESAVHIGGGSAWKVNGPDKNKSSAVAQMGDRLAATDMSENRGWGCAPFWGAGSPSNTMWPGPRPTSVPSGVLIHPTVWPQYTNVTDKTDRTDNGPIAKGEPFYIQLYFTITTW